MGTDLYFEELDWALWSSGLDGRGVATAVAVPEVVWDVEVERDATRSSFCRLCASFCTVL
jgi:hypothetical protein